MNETIDPTVAVVILIAAAGMAAFLVLECLWVAGKYYRCAWRLANTPTFEFSAEVKLEVEKHYEQAMTEIDAYLAFRQRLDVKKAQVARRGLKWQNLRKV